MGEENEWMTIAEAAQMSGYHPIYLRVLVREGKIHGVKKGMAWWVSRQSVQNYVEEARESGDGRKGPKDDA